MSALWRDLEGHLLTRATPLVEFNGSGLAADMGISRREASALIRSHLDAQRRPNATTFYVLHRTGRTSGAVWHVESRAMDMRELSMQHLDDMRCRLEQSFVPDLIRMGVLNPRATKLSEAIINAVEANLQLLEASL